jgi:predicted ATPase
MSEQNKHPESDTNPIRKDAPVDSNHCHLSRMVLRGFKSIRSCDVTLKNLTVMIGPNGAGKSNFIGFFRLVQQMLKASLQVYTGKQGGPDALLHFGRKKTETLQAELFFDDIGYKFSLEPTRDNRMMFADESLWQKGAGDASLGSGHFESKLKDHGDPAAQYLIPNVKNWCLYHFHDTGESALVKQRHGIHDNLNLKPDARNLAAFLFRLQKNFPENYARIVRLVQIIAPFFGDFHLHPDTDNPDYIELQWMEKGEDTPFKAHQLSDGTLRFICLATVLNQPEECLPQIILIDEPELGLHPRAIGFLASMLRSVSKRRQIIVSTQSVTLVNGFSIDDLIVVDRKEGVSVFESHSEQEFENWLKEYTVGDLWEKNVLGGR